MAQTVKPCLNALLEAAELQQYEGQLAVLGYIFAKDLAGVDVNELIDEAGMKKPEARRLLTAAKNDAVAVDLTAEGHRAAPTTTAATVAAVELELVLDGGKVHGVEYLSETETLVVSVSTSVGQNAFYLSLTAASEQCATNTVKSIPANIVGLRMADSTKEMKDALGLNNSDLATAAGMTGNRLPMFVGEITAGKSGAKKTQALLVVLSAYRFLKIAGADVMLAKSVLGHLGEDYTSNKKPRKDKTQYRLTTFAAHKNAMAMQLKAVLVRHKTGKSTPCDGDFMAISDSVFHTIGALVDAGDENLAALKAYTKESIAQESKTVAKIWWDQSNGKSSNSSAFIKKNFKASLLEQLAAGAAPAPVQPNLEL